MPTPLIDLNLPKVLLIIYFLACIYLAPKTSEDERAVRIVTAIFIFMTAMAVLA